MSDEEKRRIDSKFARILADNDQDLEHARKWFREATNADLIRVWKAIQQKYDDPALEVMSRLAQLKFAEMLLEREGKNQ